MLSTHLKVKATTPAGPKHEGGRSALDQNVAREPNPVWQSLAMRTDMIQPKLTVSQPDDPFEQEADRIAERVMRMRISDPSGPELSFSSVPSMRAQRKCGQCADEEEEMLQRKELTGNAQSLSSAPPIVHEGLNSSGQPLDPVTRDFMEQRFGQDLTHVRIHSDGQAAASARAVNALAFTVGRDIVFDTAEYNPSTNRGRQLLAHELTHVVQQRKAGAGDQMTASRPPRAAPIIAPEDSPAEHEADNLSRHLPASEAVASRAHAVPTDRLYRSVRIDPADSSLTLFLNTLTRLTGRAATAAGGTLVLGAALPGARPTGTVSEYIQRAISSTRAYTLRSGATTPGNLPVRGVRSEVTPAGITITVNTADAGAFTWTADELVSEGFVSAVAANDRTTQTFPATAAPGAAPVNVDDLLATTLPFASSALGASAMNLIRQRVPAVRADPVFEVDVESALMAARGVTLAEILRGLETNTPFRITQETDGDRIRARYFDPRRTPATGEHQTLPQRSVTFLAGPGRATPGAAPVRQQDLGISAAEVARVNASCTTAALSEIQAHITRAQGLITRTIARLASQENLDSALTTHFGSAGPTSRARIGANFSVILSEMDFSRHSWICTARGSGQGCNAQGVTGRTGIGQHPVQLCIEQNAPFVPRSTTVLHEVVHASGVGTLPAGTERYIWHADYPSSDPLHNADSYAQFAAAIGTGPVQTPPPVPPPPTTSPTVTPSSTVSPQTGPPPTLQRAPRRGSQAMHQDIAEEFRRRHGLPPGGRDEFGRRAGPSDAEIVYGGLLFPPPLSELASMSPWQLGQVSPDRLIPPAGTAQPTSGLTYAHYARARTVVRYLHNFFGLTYDYENDQRVKGRPPNPQELQILNNNLNQLLSTFNVRGMVTGRGGRGLPTVAGGTTASLEGRVSLVPSIGDFAGKRIQLERWAGADRTMGIPDSELERQARAQWADPATGVTAAPTDPVTNPEKVAIAWAYMASMASLEPAFFFPLEDRIYLSSHVDLTTLEGQDTARHETVHLLGGGERTRQAFIRRFGTNWKRYWKPFEEGVAELINISSRTAAQTPPSARGQGTLLSGYQSFYAQVQRLASDPAIGREAVLSAYFTGTISDAIFQRWQAIVDHP